MASFYDEIIGSVHWVTLGSLNILETQADETFWHETGWTGKIGNSIKNVRACKRKKTTTLFISCLF